MMAWGTRNVAFEPFPLDHNRRGSQDMDMLSLCKNEVEWNDGDDCGGPKVNSRTAGGSCLPLREVQNGARETGNAALTIL